MIYSLLRHCTSRAGDAFDRGLLTVYKRRRRWSVSHEVVAVSRTSCRIIDRRRFVYESVADPCRRRPSSRPSRRREPRGYAPGRDAPTTVTVCQTTQFTTTMVVFLTNEHSREDSAEPAFRITTTTTTTTRPTTANVVDYSAAITQLRALYKIYI